MFILILIIPILCVDFCRQFSSLQMCIDTNVDNCKWNQIMKTCAKTTNYHQGCNPLLNKSACVKQLSTSRGEIAKCKFSNLCEELVDLTLENCQSNLSKYACTSLLNKKDICQWVNSKCISVQNKSLIQEQFQDALYSASACSYIEGYLIMHSQILWSLINYSPDVIAEALNQEKIDLGINVEFTESYDDPLIVSLQNNYIKDGIFQWYYFRESTSITLTNLKISSRQRVGCIALEIQDDDDYLALFSLQSNFLGINHIYCSYVALNEQNTMYAAYGNKICIDVNQSLLRNKQFIIENGINCKSLTMLQCVYYEFQNQYCYIMGQEYEYQCVQTIKNQECTTTYCTQSQCKQKDLHYINTSLHVCENECSTYLNQQYCIEITECKWFNEFNGIFQANYDYMISCGPKLGCQHPGLGKKYCQLLSDICQWNQLTQRCDQLTLNQIQYYKCADANNALVCSLVSLSDQKCIWLKTTLECINVIDEPLLRLHKFYYPLSAVNKNLCMAYDMVYAQYNSQLRTCDIVASIDENTIQISNKFSCLKYTNYPCIWDIILQQCNCSIDATQLQCNALQNVNEKMCQVPKVSNSLNACLYDSQKSCCFEEGNYQQKYGCANNGWNEYECVNMQKVGQNCQYTSGACKEITISYINSQLCSALENVNQQTCLAYSNSGIACLFNSLTKSCYSTQFSLQCGDLMNRYACQSALGQCYFDLISQKCISLNDDSLLSILSCENSYVSQETCNKIVTKGQRCFWKTSQSKCFNYNDSAFNSCSQYEDSSQIICASLQNELTKRFSKDYYCEYSDQKCQSNITRIDGCGSDRFINIHRCSSSTSGTCLFVDSQCQSFDPQTRIGQIYLSQATCASANYGMCQYVTKPQQYCKWVDKDSGELLQVQCGIAQAYDTDGCDLYNEANGHACSQTEVNCIFDTNTKRCTTNIPQNTTCDAIGLSQSACLTQTIGNCCWHDKQCQYLNLNIKIECQFLNKYACIENRGKGCFFKTTCQSISQEVCVQSESLSSYSKSVCRLAQDNYCLYSNNNCIVFNDLDKISCNAPQANSLLCLNLPDQYCDFFQNKCQDAIPRKCELLSEQQCVNSIFYNCVYYNEQCFTDNNLQITCDSYDQTNYLFCQQFDGCIYNHKTHTCTQYLRKSIVNSKLILNEINTPFLCTTSLTQQSLIFVSTCEVYNKSLGCPHMQLANEQACSQNQCHFILSKSDGGFCSSIPLSQLKCEDLSITICLFHITNSLKCFINTENKCMSYDVPSQNIMQFKMNYPLSKEFTDICQLDFVSFKCKPLKFQINSCFDATTKLQCALVNNVCYYSSNLCNQSGTFSEINRQGCIQLIGDYYYYDFSQFKCIKISSNQFSCDNLNYDACTKLTPLIFCQWYNQECKDTVDIRQGECQNQNYFNCVKLENKHCYWNNGCIEFTSNTSDTCLTRKSYYYSSPKQCSSITDSPCIQSASLNSCEQVDRQINVCSGYGLNRQACLTMTSVFCYWNIDGYCDQANLQTIKCEYDVSEITCKSITTVGQICQWQNQQCVNVQRINTCEEANNISRLSSACRSVLNEACEYNQLIQKCSKLVIEPEKCLGSYNKISCSKVTNFKCKFENNTCSIQSISINSCESFLNQDLCLNNKDIPCQWTGACVEYDSEMKYCYELSQESLVNYYVCHNYSYDPCILINNSCYPTIIDANYSVYDIIQYSQYYDKTFIQGNCNQQLSEKDCISSRNGKSCIWRGLQCQPFTDFSQGLCESPLNIIGCLNISTKDQLCYWQDQCLQWTEQAPLTNVNINVCKTQSISAIWEDYSCKIYQVDQIKCDSPGISNSTCLLLTNYACLLYRDNCIYFNESNESQCQDFRNVSPFVCAIQSKFSCVYDQQQQACRPSTYTDTYDTLGISKLACLSIQSEKTYWINNSCKLLEINIECDQDIYVNPLSCSSVTFNRQPCVYDSIHKKCTSSMSILSLTCLTPGLNIYGCIQVQMQPCIFQNSKCIIFNNFTSQCLEISNVNAFTCASIKNQECFYDVQNFKCSIPLSNNNECSTVGLSYLSCTNNQLCGWIDDTKTCVCKDQRKESICSQFLSYTDCNSHSLCYWSYNQCYLKQCYHLNTANCTGSFQNKLCYATVSEECQPALSCEDIYNPKDDCESFLFNGQACKTSVVTNQYCYSPNNLVNYCLNSTECLNENCIQVLGTCRIRSCWEINDEAQCTNTPNCLYTKGQCLHINACSDVLNIDPENSDILCNKATVGNFKCNWQQVTILEQEKTCTSLACDLYGGSPTFCQGNESNNYACVLSYGNRCISCEQITESCFCKSQIGICKYENSNCLSILCSDYLTQNQCQQTEPRCYWSFTQEKCLRACAKVINEDECNERTVECYFNPLTQRCIQGTKEKIDETIIIEVENVFQGSLRIFIVIFILM